MGAGARDPAGSRLRFLVLGYVIWLVVVRVCGFAGLRVRGFAGSRLRYLAGVIVRVRGVRVLGCVIRFVWLLSWLVGAGARDLAGSRLCFLVLGYVIWLVVVRVCGF